MIEFILNQNEIRTDISPQSTLLDFIRYRQHLTGTKIGCREGDCGACTILIGELKNRELSYSSTTSCLMPLANAHGKHIVTIEGINMPELGAVQHAFAEEGATQCGFCTPGFIVSLTGFCISDRDPSVHEAINSMNGNICRCTGYKSIERAAARVNEKMQSRKGTDPVQFAMDNNMIPSWFKEVRQRLEKIMLPVRQLPSTGAKIRMMGGGTDLYVQQHDTILEEEVGFLYDNPQLKGINKIGNTCEIGASVTVTDMAESAVFKDHFPGLHDFVKLVSSTQIRNMATIAGNFANASPIGDLTIFFLALDAKVQLDHGKGSRQIKLKDLYKGYKSLDKTTEEMISKIIFDLPGPQDLFNFEKVCKRTYLDIASVNTAIYLKVQNEEIKVAALSAGGVGPVPSLLANCSEFLCGKKVDVSTIKGLLEITQTEIKPISDVRGSEKYKRMLLSQLIKAHFIKLFPWLPAEQVINA